MELSHFTHHHHNSPCLTYGMRGTIHIEVRVHGPKRNLHSGEWIGMHVCVWRRRRRRRGNGGKACVHAYVSPTHALQPSLPPSRDLLNYS